MYSSLSIRFPKVRIMGIRSMLNGANKRQKPMQTSTGLAESFILARLYPITNKQRHLLHLKLLLLSERGFPRRE